MENASEALIMAGQVLLFIIALTICISSFTTLRAESDTLIGQDEAVQMAKNGSEYINYIASKEGGSIRVVKADTVVSSMYRAIKENYVVYLKLKNNKSNNTILRDSNVTEMQAIKDVNVKIADVPIIKQGDTIIQVKIGINTNQYIDEVLENGLYSYLQDKEYYEYLGEYKDYTAEGVSEVEKKTNRIITYIEK